MPAALLAVALALQSHVLTLDQAEKTAASHQPQLRAAQAQTDAARARVTEARAPLLPQIVATGQYQRTTSNFAPQPGTVPNSTENGRPAANWSTFNFWSLGVAASQLIYDFGQTSQKWRAAEANAEAQADTQRSTSQSIVLAVRTAYFTARANKGLLQVAKETLANQDKHLEQIKGFVEVGTRPEIDLAQAKTDRANALVSLINAENAYEAAKAQLNTSMGVEGPTDYDVADEALPPIDGEDQPLDGLVKEAHRSRPDLWSLTAQVRAQELTVSQNRGGYFPTLSAGTAFTDRSPELETLDQGWNWNAQINLSWPLFQGLLTRGQVREAEANLAATEAQKTQLEQQVRLDVDQARLAVRAAKASIGAAEEALFNARERLRLAEGRYQAGTGSVIELGDAQVALTQAASQKVSADYNLATARAQLAKALGRA
jgi:outer membrane protein